MVPGAATSVNVEAATLGVPVQLAGKRYGTEKGVPAAGIPGVRRELRASKPLLRRRAAVPRDRAVPAGALLLGGIKAFCAGQPQRHLIPPLCIGLRGPYALSGTEICCALVGRGRGIDEEGRRHRRAQCPGPCP
eukprot:1136375-Rhodomonas_salina.2